MTYPIKILKNKLHFATLVLLLILPALLNGQGIKIGLHADPVISWFGSDISSERNVGTRPGFNFGLEITKPFGPNYSFETGLNIINAGGRLESDEITILKLSDLRTVTPNSAMVYKIQYLAIPLGLKLKTNQIGYITFFTDVGFDPKVIISSKIGVPSLDIEGENASGELKLFNTGYYITAGIEYGLGGNTALVAGLGFENNFLDITKDLTGQPNDKVTHKLISFRLGINF